MGSFKHIEGAIDNGLTFKLDEEQIVRIEKSFMQRGESERFTHMVNSYCIRFDSLKTSTLTVPLALEGYAADPEFLYEQQWKADGSFCGSNFSSNPIGEIRYDDETRCPLPKALKAFLRELAAKIGCDCTVTFRSTPRGSKVDVTIPDSSADPGLANAVLSNLPYLARD